MMSYGVIPVPRTGMLRIRDFHFLREQRENRERQTDVCNALKQQSLLHAIGHGILCIYPPEKPGDGLEVITFCQLPGYSRVLPAGETPISGTSSTSYPPGI